MSLQDQVVLVTGGSRGNGRGIAEGFAAEGARVALVDIAEDGVHRTAGEIGQDYGVETTGHRGDVSIREDVEQTVAAVTDRFGRIDVLVNNAGIMPQAPFLEISLTDYQATMRVNLDGVFHCSQVVASRMVDQGDGGSIINISSMAAVIAPPGTASYCASKGAVSALTRAMAVDLAEHRIRVNAIAPGVILTDLNRHLFENDEARLQRAIARVPAGRIGYPADLAGAAIFLASEAAAYVTGASIPVDGGYVAR